MDPAAAFHRVTESLETFASAQYMGVLADGDGIVSIDSGAVALEKILRFVAGECGAPVLTVVRLFDGMRDLRRLLREVFLRLHLEGEEWAQVVTGVTDGTAGQDWQWEPEMEPETA